MHERFGKQKKVLFKSKTQLHLHDVPVYNINSCGLFTFSATQLTANV